MSYHISLLTSEMCFSVRHYFCRITIRLNRRDCDCNLCRFPASDIDRCRNKKHRQHKDCRMKYHLHLVPDSERFDKRRNHEKRNPASSRDAKNDSAGSHEQHLPIDQTVDLVSCHPDRLEQSIVTDISCDRQIHNIVDQQIGAHAGNKDQCQKSQIKRNRISKFRHKENSLPFG